MTQIFTIHHKNPQRRLLEKASDVISSGGVIIYPTDSTYALACALSNKDGIERVKKLRALSDKHHFTLICRDLSQISQYAVLNNSLFRMMKRNTPGPFTFILPASNAVPKLLKHPKRKTVGIRIPQHEITQGLLDCHGEPLMSTTLRLPGAEVALFDPDEIRDKISSLQVDLFIDGGFCGIDPTTVIEWVDNKAQVTRQSSATIVELI